MKTLLTLTLGALLLGSQSGCSEEVQAHPHGSNWTRGSGWGPGQWTGRSGSRGSYQRWGMPNGAGALGHRRGPGRWNAGPASTPAQQKARARLWAKYGKKIDNARLKLLKVESALRRLRWSAQPDPKAISAKVAEAERLGLKLRTLQRRMWTDSRQPASSGNATLQPYRWHGSCSCGGGCGW